MMALEGGSVGFQIGGQATDFVILVMNNRGADSVLHSKVKLGGDASADAGGSRSRPNCSQAKSVHASNIPLTAKPTFDIV